LQLTYHVLILGVVLGALIYALRWEARPAQKVVVVLAGMALLSGGLFQTIQVWAQAFGWSNPPEFTMALFNFGEGMAVLCPLAAWWILRISGSPTAGQQIGQVSMPAHVRWLSPSAALRPVAWSTYLWASIPAFGFSALTIVNPAMAGVLAIWSTGLTLFLPWPIYALSLWLLGVIVITAWRSGEPVGWALLLLAAGGYAPQLSSQAFFGLIGLILLCRSIQPANRLHSNVALEDDWLETGGFGKIYN
jgi:hypothetical protein